MWLKKNLLNHQNDSKNFDHGFLKNLSLLFIIVLKALIVKKQSYFGWNLLYLFSGNVVDQN